MSKRGILGQPRCVLSFRHNFLFGTILGKSGPEDQIVPNRKLCLKLKTHPGWPEIPILLIYAQLGGAKVWCYRFICPKPGTPGAYLGEKRPEKDRNATGFGSSRPNRKLCVQTHVSAVFGPIFAQTGAWGAWFWPYEHIAPRFSIP